MIHRHDIARVSFEALVLVLVFAILFASSPAPAYAASRSIAASSDQSSVNDAGGTQNQLYDSQSESSGPVGARPEQLVPLGINLTRTLPQGWSLLSVPLTATDTLPSQVLQDIKGPLNLFGYAGGSVLEVGDLDFPTISPGNAFWILLESETDITVDGDMADPTVEFRKAISPGWNPIASPWPVPVDWSDDRVSIQSGGATVPLSQAIVNDWILRTAFDYDDVGKTYSDVLANNIPIADQLAPWKGYFIFSDVDAEIIFSPPGFDGTPPFVEITEPANNGEVNWLTDVIGTASDDNLVEYELELSPFGENDFSVFATGNTSVVSDILGELDPSLLINGLFILRLSAVDIGGNEASTISLVLVEGGAKVGIFRITYIDMDIPLAGVPIVITRTYDSREKTQEDFGVGWTLDIAQGSYTNEPTPGEGWQILPGAFNLPCQQVAELLPHTTLVRLSEGEGYQFRLKLSNVGATLGGCAAEAGFEFVAGTFQEARLEILGNRDVVYVNGSDFLTDLDFKRFDPQRVRLTTYDGRVFDLDLDSGITRIRDTNGNSLTINSSGIFHSSGEAVTFTRDGAGRITEITGPDANAVSYEYDANGDLVSVTDQDGNISSFTYDDLHNLIDIIDPRGNRLQRNDYDENGRLIGTTDANGNTITFDHDINGRREVVTDRLGNATALEYDESGNVITRIDPTGGVTSNTFDDQGNRTSVTGPFGNTTTFQYDPNSNLLERVDPLGNTWSFTYDANGNQLTATDAEGNVQTSIYDANGNLLSFDDGDGGVLTATYDGAGNLASVSDMNGNSHILSSNAAGFLTSWTNPAGVTSDIVNDGAGNILQEEYIAQTPAGPQTVTYDYTLNKGGRISQIQGPQNLVSSAEYDGLGAVTSMTDSTGRRTDLDYDSLGRLSGLDLNDGTQWGYEYDREGRLTKVSRPDGTTIERAYDEVGRVIGITRADGGTTETTYDVGGRITAVSDPLGNATSFEYDAADRRTKVIGPLLGETLFEFDGNGFVIAQIDPEGRRVEFDRDGKGRVTEIRYMDGASVIMAYDGEGNLTEHVDPIGKVTSLEYDVTGLLAGVTDALGGVTTYSRSEEGAVTEITDANNNQTIITRDRYRRATGQTLPLGQSETREYDSGGRLVSRRDFLGRLISFDYDTKGRLIERFAEDGTRQNFEHDPAGRLTSAREGTDTWEYEYDPMGRLIKFTEPDGRAVSYKYDLAGRQTEVTTPAGTTSYTYDTLGRMVSMTDSDSRTTTWDYDKSSRLLSTLHANGTESKFTYDTRGLLASVEELDSAGATLFGESYTRSATGRITTVDRDDGTKVTYDYDDLGRLVSESFTPAGGPAEVTTYGYDAVGNRTNVTDSSGTRVFTNDANGRLLNDGIFGYTYDDNGNLIQRSSADETLNFTYDAFGRMVQVDRTEGVGPSEIRYLYDPTGVLIGRIVDGVVENYLVDRAARFSRVLEESAADGTVTARNFYGLGIEAREAAGDFSVMHADHLGSIRLTTDAAGDVGSVMDYDAFGNTRGDEVADQNPYRFTGERFDSDIGALFLRTRFYWPDAGRYLEKDPAPPSLSDPGSLHRYVYVLNDPVNRIDPSGRFGVVSLSISISLNMSMRNVMQQVNIAIAEAAFATAGGLKIFKFRGDPDGVLVHVPFAAIEAQLGFLTGAFEVWDFRNGGKAAFLATGVSLTYETFDASAEIKHNSVVWEAPTPTDYEGPFMTFSYSAAYLMDFKKRLPLLTIPLGIKGSFKLFLAPIPSRNLDIKSKEFGQTLQAHGYGWAISIAVGNEHGGSTSLGFNFSVYCLLDAEDERFKRTCGFE